MLLEILVVLCFIPIADVTENKILVAQRPLLTVDNKTATLICNYSYNGTGEEFRASLHKGANSAVEVCFISWNTSKIVSNLNKKSNCQVTHDKGKVIFNLWNMSASQTDIYFCKIEAMYPPPYVCNEKSNGTVIHVKEETHVEIQEPQSAVSLWIIVAMTGILALYSMLITAVFINYWQKSKKNLYHQNDYMNMTPRHPQYQKKGYPSYAPTRDYTAYRSWQP